MSPALFCCVATICLNALLRLIVWAVTALVLVSTQDESRQGRCREVLDRLPWNQVTASLRVLLRLLLNWLQ